MVSRVLEIIKNKNDNKILQIRLTNEQLVTCPSEGSPGLFSFIKVIMPRQDGGFLIEKNGPGNARIMLPHLYGNLCDFEICDFESFGNKNIPFSTYEQFKLETDNDQEWIEVPDQIQQRKLLRA